jgi:hypothetical protein
MEGTLVKAKGRHGGGAYGSALCWVLAVLTVTVIAIPALATTAQAAQVRTVAGNVVFQIMDYENVGANERCRREFRLTPRDIEVGNSNSKKITLRARCGGEIRVEVHYRLTQQPQQNGLILVTEGLVEFYEGDSENTDDRDGVKAFSHTLIRPGQSTTWKIHVQNVSEMEPDDKADVTLTLRNL